MARLGEIASVITKGTTPTTIGYNFAEEGINFIKIESIGEDGSFIPSKFGHIDHECHTALKRSQLAENDILFSIAGAIGRTARVDKSILPANTNQALAIIRIPEGVIDYSYLLYALHSPHITEQFEKRKQGVAQLNLSLKDISELEIPDLSDEEQKYIVSILDKISTLINIRKQQLSKLDQLVNARFVEMFGDPEFNNFGWPCYCIDDIITFEGGRQPEKKFFEYEKSDTNIRLIQIRDYRTDKYLTYIPKHLAKSFCSKTDIMIGRYGPPIFQIFEGIEGSYNVALMKAVPKKGNRIFIREFLKQEKLLRYLEGMSQRTAGQDGIQMDKLKTYPFPFPPLPLQEEFATFVQQVEKSKAAVKQSLEKLETLKKSLMQEYFG